MWTRDGRGASSPKLPKTPSVFERAGSLMNEETISETDSAHWSPFRLRERERCWDVKGSPLPVVFAAGDCSGHHALNLVPLTAGSC